MRTKKSVEVTQRHDTIVETERHLTRARDTFTNAQTNANTALRSVVGDGTGDKKVLADARAVAKEFGFTLTLAAPLEPKKAAKAKTARKSSTASSGTVKASHRRSHAETGAVQLDVDPTR